MESDESALMPEREREKLKIGEPDMSPLRDAWITDVVTGIEAQAWTCSSSDWAWLIGGWVGRRLQQVATPLRMWRAHG